MLDVIASGDLARLAAAVWQPGVARAIAVPGMLAAIIGIHFAYFRSNRRRNGQQRIMLEDFTILGDGPVAATSGLTIVLGNSEEFDATARTARKTNLSAPPGIDQCASQRPQRLQGAQLIEDSTRREPLICDDDMVLRGRTFFCNAVKVSGDLVVDGHAVFLAPVTVNGVLKINGEAHFAAGIVSKGDALVRGSLAIGSNDRRGWGVVRELAIQTRLALNGTLVTDRAVQVREAA